MGHALRTLIMIAPSDGDTRYARIANKHPDYFLQRYLIKSQCRVVEAGLIWAQSYIITRHEMGMMLRECTGEYLI